MKFKQLPVVTNRFATETELLRFWQKNRVFEKSIEQRPASQSYSFYDGPPFVTGMPHYGTLLSSISKDLLPRFFTMKGKRIRRVWGWDCHGLPIENKVENKFNLKTRKDIQKIGLERFIKECFNYVSTASPEWKWYIDHVGRWVDFDNAYKTMDLTYMETVIWVFKQIYDKGLIYQGKRVSLYCPRCVTPVSNFEIAMDNSYIDIVEPSNVYKYQLKGQSDTYILAWSTTPWNKLATPALAVNPNLTYVKVKQKKEYYILAESTLKILVGKYQVVDSFKGKKLEGVHFVPHYDFYPIKKGDYAYVITTGDFVTAEEGTGVVTIAVYGEDDYQLMKQKNIPPIEHIDEEGRIKNMVRGFEGLYYLDANPKVNADLASRNLVYKEEKHQHSVPVCWRCKTRLIYAPQKAWFINIQKLKKQLLQTNEKVNWVPEHIKHGRFALGIKEAPDWCISRNRYWATPMPVWQCEKCSERKIVGSVAEIEKLSGKKVVNLHRPYIDKFYFTCSKCQGQMKRVPEVLDCWLESGSMPYGERHYPFENKADFHRSFPADFISEYVAQTRAWFYVMHVVSNALFQTNCFKNVVVSGVIMGTDGRKMSKSYGNYPDPKKTIETYGGDAVRLYLMASQLLSGENINVSEEDIKDKLKSVLLPAYNSLRYFTAYADLHHFSPGSRQSKHILDRWLEIRTKKVTQEMDNYLTHYLVPPAVRLIQPFINDLSTWYIRLSRTRFVNGDREALNTLYRQLKILAQITAPVIPFFSDEIWQVLKTSKDKPSVHLTDYPEGGKLTTVETKLMEQMDLIREIVSLGHRQRKEQQLPVRQPLANVWITSRQSPPEKAFVDLIIQELNVKAISWKKGTKDMVLVKLDTLLTPELKDEGEARRLVRKISAERKKMGLGFEDKVSVVLPEWPAKYSGYIKKNALVDQLVKGSTFEVKKI
jgi:isoleucyl-tRNA synthetase